jgi:protein-S-isoprenylcysteine O-methyltransferase Ste14
VKQVSKWRFDLIHVTMSIYAMIIQYLAAASGLVVILLPLGSVLRASRRPKGRTIGSGTTLRKWSAVAAMTIGFVAFGVLLWKPLPVRISSILKVFLLVLGSLLYFPAIGVYLWGWATLGKDFGVSTYGGADVYADHRLVKNGPYRQIRHPMYLVVMVAAIGALLIFRTWAMVAFVPMSWVVMRRANQEEALLEMEYGIEWREYAQEVPKWLPRWIKRGS